MAIVGWLFLCVIAGFLSLLVILATLNNFGPYNIGGVPNSAGAQILTLLGIVVVLGIWYLLLFQWAPFKIIII